jgi:hypothetical protein
LQKNKNSSNLKIINKNNFIFSKNINNKYKLIPFSINKNNVGEIKYFPSSSKEWRNKVYFFNSNNLKNLPVYDMNVNDLLKDYFKLYFYNKELKYKLIPHKLKRLSLNKIFVSNTEISHTNSKIIITIYTYNREIIVLLKRLVKLKKSLFTIKKLFFNCKNITENLYSKLFKNILYKELIYIRRFKLRLDLNKLKFKDKFLFTLNKLISRFYNKKVEFNIINLKSIALNSNILTEIMKLKLKNRRINALKVMDFILAKGKMLKENNLRKRIIKNVNFNLIQNIYKNININSIIHKNNLDKVLTSTFNKENSEIKYIIFDNINYKNVGGLRLEIKGRLTKRYRADRAIFKVKWKGGLKNVDSSYKGLSVVNFRGNVNSNVEYSMGVSKRRIGAFAVKGWISGR